MNADYDSLADAILGPFVRPFDSFVPTVGINASTGQWYGSNFASGHSDLAQLLVAHAGARGWILEVGSFIGGSAKTFVRAARRLNLSTPLVCIDSWSGDLPMWLKKGSNLGPRTHSSVSITQRLRSCFYLVSILLRSLCHSRATLPTLWLHTLCHCASPLRRGPVRRAAPLAPIHGQPTRDGLSACDPRPDAGHGRVALPARAGRSPPHPTAARHLSRHGT